MNDYVHIEAADLRRPNARFTTERQRYQVLTPFGKLGYSQFLMVKPAGVTGAGPERTDIIVVENWFEELKRLVPTN